MSVGKAAHTHGSAEFVLISIGNRPLPEIPREPLTISRNRDTIIRLDQLDIDGPLAYYRVNLGTDCRSNAGHRRATADAYHMPGIQTGLTLFGIIMLF
jgi:hypothetical protein